jgi:hypothetical protein
MTTNFGREKLFPFTGLGLVRNDLLIHKLNRKLVLGIKCSLLGIMLFETTGNISSNAGVKRCIAAFYYIEVPGHRIGGDYTLASPLRGSQVSFPDFKITGKDAKIFLH